MFFAINQLLVLIQSMFFLPSVPTYGHRLSGWPKVSKLAGGFQVGLRLPGGQEVEKWARGCQVGRQFGPEVIRWAEDYPVGWRLSCGLEVVRWAGICQLAGREGESWPEGGVRWAKGLWAS
jgi:hypothetical protein